MKNQLSWYLFVNGVLDGMVLDQEFISIYFNIQYCESMSKLLKKDHSPLKFDTSFANIHCFIRTKSKQKHPDHELHPRMIKNKKKGKNEHKQPEFQDKAFLQSVVCKILNDADCQGINELIDNMVFPPASPSGQPEPPRDYTREEIEEEEISLIFSNFSPYRGSAPHSPHYRILTPAHPHSSAEKQERATTIHSSFNSFAGSPREGNSNPEIQMLKGMGPLLPPGYSYGYYPQPNCLYPRQVSQRKRRTVSGEEANEYRIMAQQIESDGRTTLMIRHIPNKYSEEMLLQQIGKKHRQRINFLYLPIDHYNSCNVGYAFANFIHTKFIFEFHQEFNGRRWDRYNSEKICELAYARIQGTTNLMDHFQTPNNQVRARTNSKAEERKKSNVELDEDAIKGLNKIIDHQKVEEL